MAVLTIAVLKAQLNAQINTNGVNGITGASLNGNLQDIVDSLDDLIIPVDYKVYIAHLSQSGTNPPVATIIRNTLDSIPIWDRSQAGSYFMTLANAFPLAKTEVLHNNVGLSPSAPAVTSAYRENDNTVFFDMSDGTNFIDDNFYNNASIIKVKVYN